MLFNIIGAGKLGKNIGLALASSGQATLGGVFNKGENSALRAVAEIGSGFCVAKLSDLPAAPLTFITAPDDDVAAIAQDLARSRTLTAGSTLVHCSGVLSSDILLPLRQQECHTASFHPLKAFREGIVSADVFRDCDCAMEGDAHALAMLTTLFETLGARLITINPAHKAIYHAAAVMSANYLVTLANIAVELFSDAGIPPSQAKEITLRLMQGSFDNIRFAPTLAGALTGPLARGDEHTIQRHLQALDKPEIRAFYKAGALATLPLTTLDEEMKKTMARAMESSNNF